MNQTYTVTSVEVIISEPNKSCKLLPYTCWYPFHNNQHPVSDFWTQTDRINLFSL